MILRDINNAIDNVQIEDVNVQARGIQSFPQFTPEIWALIKIALQLVKAFCFSKNRASKIGKIIEMIEPFLPQNK